jgi:flagellar basal-body rod protein FlgB
MDLNQIPLFKSIVRRMDWLNQRQRVLAQNIANADTPDYKARDLKPVDFSTLVGRARSLQLAATRPGHLPIRTGEGGAIGREEENRSPYEVSPTGNSVVLEEQLLDVADTRMDYETMSNLYRKHVGFIKTALGRGK